MKEIDFDAQWVAYLNLSVRAHNALHDAKIWTLRELVSLEERKIVLIRNFGETSLRNVKQALAPLGLALGMKVPYEKNKKPLEPGSPPTMRIKFIIGAGEGGVWEFNINMAQVPAKGDEVRLTLDWEGKGLMAYCDVWQVAWDLDNESAIDAVVWASVNNDMGAELLGNDIIMAQAKKRLEKEEVT